MAKKRKMTEAEHDFLDQMQAHADWLRELAEKGLADLERRVGHRVRPEGLSNADWLRQLAEQGKTKLEQQA